MQEANKRPRIAGIDVARAFAIVGMIIVNFKVVFGSEGSKVLRSLAGFLEGKAAATFVVLAGVGMALVMEKALLVSNAQKIARNRINLLKRAGLLFLIGLTYLSIWPADILHFYGVYILVTIPLLTANRTWSLIIAGLLIISYPVLMLLLDYDSGWDYETLHYAGFWTFEGFMRNLFYNGFHPVIPWSAFMMAGVWLGKSNLRAPSFIRKLFIRSSLVFFLTQLLSVILIYGLSENNPEIKGELRQVLGFSPMPPLPFYMISGTAFAFMMIAACIWWAEKYAGHSMVKNLSATGQMALTFYVAHVLLGMGLPEILFPGSLGKYSIGFSVGYGVFFSILCMIFAGTWKKYRSSGPLEWVFRQLLSRKSRSPD